MVRFRRQNGDIYLPNIKASKQDGSFCFYSIQVDVRMSTAPANHSGPQITGRQ